jgi:hypothetical protein
MRSLLKCLILSLPLATTAQFTWRVSSERTTRTLSGHHRIGRPVPPYLFAEGDDYTNIALPTISGSSAESTETDDTGQQTVAEGSTSIETSLVPVTFGSSSLSSSIPSPGPSNTGLPLPTSSTSVAIASISSSGYFNSSISTPTPSSTGSVASISNDDLPIQITPTPSSGLQSTSTNSSSLLVSEQISSSSVNSTQQQSSTSSSSSPTSTPIVGPSSSIAGSQTSSGSAVVLPIQSTPTASDSSTLVIAASISGLSSTLTSSEAPLASTPSVSSGVSSSSPSQSDTAIPNSVQSSSTTPSSSTTSSSSTTPSSEIVSSVSSTIPDSISSSSVESSSPTPVTSSTPNVPSTFSTVVVTPIVSSTPATTCSNGQIATPSTCLVVLPPACSSLSSPTLLGAILSQADLLACKVALGVLATVNAAECFTTSLASDLTGSYVLRCLQTGVLCNSCISSLPDACTTFFSDTSIIDNTVLGACQAALGNFGLGRATLCFDVGVSVSSLTGVNVGACLQQSVSLCPTVGCIASTPTPTPITTPTPSPSSIPTITPIPCIVALPSVCSVPNSGLLSSIVTTVDTVACQLALNALLPTNLASVCFGVNLSTLTGQDFAQCLAINFPICSTTPTPTPTPTPIPTPTPATCIASLPPICIAPGSGLLSPVLLVVDTLGCQSALNALLTPNPAALCFSTNLLGTLTGQDFGLCLATNFPLCPTTPSPTPTPTPIPTPTPTPTSIPSGCIATLPSVCAVSSSGLLAPVLLTVDTLGCQLALNGLLSPNPAALCFSTNLLSTLTGNDFGLCLAANFPLCT